MAHYTWSVGSPLGSALRAGLDDLRSAKHKLLDTLGAMNQMSNAEIATAYGFSDATVAAAAKAELAADAGKLDPADAAGAALTQMLNQFA